MRRVQQIVAVSFVLSVGTVSAAGPEVEVERSIRGSAEVTFLKLSTLPAGFTECNSGGAVRSELAAVNNGGVVAAMAQADSSAGCPLRGYLWDPSTDGVDVIPFPAPLPDYRVTALRIAALSTNLVSGGMTILDVGFGAALELATYADGLTAHLIPNFSSVMGVSENGAYLSGTNEVNVPLLFDHATRQVITVNIGPVPVQSSILYKVSNAGVAVGSMLPPVGDAINVAIICAAATASCEQVLGGPAQGFFAFLQGISASGDHIYGFVNDGQSHYQLFSLDPLTYDVTPLDPGYIIGNTSPVTDDGSLVVLDANFDAYLFVPFADGSHAIYDVDQLVRKLKLPPTVSENSIQLSPDGHYAAFEVNAARPSGRVVAARVYFEDGIATWAKENLHRAPPRPRSPEVIP